QHYAARELLRAVRAAQEWPPALSTLPPGPSDIDDRSQVRQHRTRTLPDVPAHVIRSRSPYHPVGMPKGLRRWDIFRSWQNWPSRSANFIGYLTLIRAFSNIAARAIKPLKNCPMLKINPQCTQVPKKQPAKSNKIYRETLEF